MAVAVADCASARLDSSTARFRSCSARTLSLVASCVSTLAGSGARVYADCGTTSGSMTSVVIYAANVPTEVDAYNIVVNFSPSVFRYLGFAPSETLFEPTACSNGSTLCLEG